MSLRNAVVLTLTLLISPVQADEAACLASPTRECVFQLAIDRFEASDEPSYAFWIPLHVAAWEEAIGAENAEKTAEQMLELERWIKLSSDERLAISILFFQTNYVGRSPALSRKLAEVLASENTSVPYLGDTQRLMLPEQSTAAFFAGLSGDRERAREIIIATDENERILAIKGGTKGLLYYGDVDGALEIAELAPGNDLMAEIKGQVLISFLLGRNFEAAISLAEGMDREEDIAQALLDVAHRLARDGRVDEAVKLVQRPMVAQAIEQDREIAETAAWIYAYAGDIERMNSLFSDDSDTLMPRLIAAMVTIDEETAVALMKEVGEITLGIRLQAIAIRAYLDAHPDDLDLLFSHVPENQIPDVLLLVASHQAIRGDIEAALETLDQFRAMEEDINESEKIAWLFAPALARAGYAREAIKMAEESKDLILLLEVAVLIEDPEFSRADFPVINVGRILLSTE